MQRNNLIQELPLSFYLDLSVETATFLFPSFYEIIIEKIKIRKILLELNDALHPVYKGDILNIQFET